MMTRAACMLHIPKSTGHMHSQGVGTPAVSVLCGVKEVARLGPGPYAWHSCAFECFLPPTPNPGRPEAGGKTDRACVAAFLSRVYALFRPRHLWIVWLCVQCSTTWVLGGQGVLRHWISIAGFGRKRRVDVPRRCSPTFISSSLGCYPTWLYCSRCGRRPFATRHSCLASTHTQTHRDAREGCRPRTMPRLEAVSEEGGREGGDMNESSDRGIEERGMFSMSSAFQYEPCPSACTCNHTLGVAISCPSSLHPFPIS